MAELKGFAVLPADTFADGPPSGNFINTNNRETPFDSQPVQGFSGVQFAPGSEDGSSYWFLSDNGFGSQGNSADYLLRLYQVDPDFAGAEDGDASVDVQAFVQLADPDNLIPFDIVNEDTSDRLLTGADFDIESFVIDNNGDIWIGEEFGPYILHFDSTGTLLEAPIATPNPEFQFDTLNGQVPLVIGHRGASGERPEHTLEAYELAIAQGADFIEPDLVPTSDGVLIARHENALATVELDDDGNIVLDANGNPIVESETTNVADLPQFADRLTVKEIDGDLIGGWFSEDFTWEEIRDNLLARERIPGTRPDNTAFNDQFQIPRLEQIIDLVNEVEAETGEEIGIYPETKHPTFFAEEGTLLDGTTPIDINTSQILAETLVAENFTDPDRIFIQSFEFANLIELQELLDNAVVGDIPLVQLYGNTTAGANPNSSFSFPYDIRFNVAEGNDLTAIYGQEFLDALDEPLSEDTVYADLDSPELLEVLGDLYAEGAGPWKNNILLRDSIDPPVDGNEDGVAEIRSQLTGEITSFIEDAHDAGLQVHPYTLRNEENFLTLNPDGTPQTPEDEFRQLIQIGADGFFTDFPGTGRIVVDQITSDEVRSPQNPDIQFDSLSGEAPLVIGHRGASGERPEHTLEAYELAIAQGAEFIEPDLVPTSDGVLIARHENALATVELDENGEIVFDANGNPIIESETTNVADLPQFADRLTVKEIDGDLIGGWFSEDFTWAEIRDNLLARERIPGTRPDNTAFNDQFQIPRLEQIIDLVNEVEAETGEEIGIYPETKHPTFFDKEGTFLDGTTPIDINTSQILADTLVAEDFTDPDRIFIQSFEIENLLELQNEILPAAEIDIPLVQLTGDFEGTFVDDGAFSVPYDVVYNFTPGNANAEPDTYDNFPIEFDIETNYGDLANAEVISFIGETYAEGLGPWKNSFLLRENIDPPVDGDGDGNAQIRTQLTGEVLPLIDWAHDAGLQVHPYTLRNEENFLTLNPDGTPQTPEDEVRQLIDLGVDGFFTDFPETGRIVVDQETELPNLPRTRGYEGMAFSPDRETFYPLLEGAVAGDPENALRIYEFDPASSSFEGLVGFYPTDVAGHAIGDFTPINETEFLVIERDGGQGDTAQFKKIFKIDISEVDDEGFVAKEEVVDLLDIDDPNDLNDDGETDFDFPFVTIEDVLVLDKETILVANDNNYPFSIGRGPDIDNNEIILLELDEPLDLAPGIGVAIPTVGIEVEPETVDENGAEYSLTFNLNVPAPEGGLRVIWSETDSDDAFGDIDFPPELTNASNLEELDPVGDELARSAITINEGATTATVTWTTLFDSEEEGDETTTIELQPEDGYIVDSENQVAEVVIEDVSIDDGVQIEGTAEAERLSGGTGDDTIVGLNGADTLAGSFGDDEIIGSRGDDFLYGQDGNDTLEGRLGVDFLFGGDGDDILNGGQGRDRFNGGAGDDTMTGGASIDSFIYNTNGAFDSENIGVDTILEFQEIDLILLDKSTFTALDSAAGIGFSVDSDFAIVTDDDDVDGSSALIVYSEESGGLFYNTGNDSTQFAILDGAPTITEDNFQIR